MWAMQPVSLRRDADTHGRDHVEETPDDSTNVTQQLAQLGELHTQGALTDEEFAAAKKKLLERL